MSAVTLVSTAEVAQRLGVDVRTVHRMVSEGTLTPAAKLPGKTGAYVFDPADIEALVESRKGLHE